MDEYDDWFSDLEDDDLLALAALCEDDFGPDGFIEEDEVDLWEDEEPGDDRPPDAAEKDVAERKMRLICGKTKGRETIGHRTPQKRTSLQ